MWQADEDGNLVGSVERVRRDMGTEENGIDVFPLGRDGFKHVGDPLATEFGGPVAVRLHAPE